MAKRKYTINDATKEELITYFFQPDCFGGGFRIPAAKDSFLLWLSKKRNGELLKAGETAAEAEQEAMHEYLDYIKKSIEEVDIDKKIELAKLADKAYRRYEKMGKLRRESWDMVAEGYEI